MSNVAELPMKKFSEPRTLTDADVEAIAEALKGSFKEDFYSDLGKGVFALFKKVFYILIVAVAAYGAAKGIESK